MPATLHWLEKRAAPKQSEAGGAAAAGEPADPGRGRRPFRRAAERGLAPRLSVLRAFGLALLVSTLLWGLILWAVVAVIR